MNLKSQNQPHTPTESRARRPDHTPPGEPRGDARVAPWRRKTGTVHDEGLTHRVASRTPFGTGSGNVASFQFCKVPVPVLNFDVVDKDLSNGREPCAGRRALTAAYAARGAAAVHRLRHRFTNVAALDGSSDAPRLV